MTSEEASGPSDREVRQPQKGTGIVYQQLTRPEGLFRHVFVEDEGFLVTFTAQQGRFRDPGTRPNELADIRQRSWPYPSRAEEAAQYLIDEAQLERESYFGVHLFREAGNRRAANTVPTLRALWLDEDEGHFPETGPEPTATVRSSAGRRHLYWRLSHPVAVEWAVTMNRRLAAWAGGDVGKAGAASVLRAPGTANYKRHPRVDLVVGEFTGALPWEPEIMEQAVPELPQPKSSPIRAEPYDGPDVDLAPYLENVEILGNVPDSVGTKYAIVCPWVNEHSGGDRSGTRVGHRAGGGLWFHCDHEHCQGRGWSEFRLAVRGQVIRITRRASRPDKVKTKLERTVNITRE